ncbi:MAG: hypothetical protein RMM06_02395 [Armatimonadota bacterium]|nr:hypothetical protein [Armatimonadota bacterium]
MFASQEEFVLFAGVSVAALLIFMLFREARIALLRRAAEKTLLEVRRKPQRLAGATNTATECAVLASITVADYVLEWASIDASVIAAADFASTEHIRNGLDFARYIHDHLSNLSETAKQGAMNRLLGYVGEQKVATILSEQGHVVEFAEEANQPVWDLLVDGKMVNVKTVSDIASIQEIAAQNPDVTYIVPEDAEGLVSGNIVRLEGFTYEGAQESLQEAIAQANGENALDAILHHLPWVTIGFTVYRRYKAVQGGQPLDSAFRMGSIEVVCHAAGIVTGAKIGSILGSVFGPIGTLFGATVGAVAGRIVSGMVATEWKLGPFRQAMQRLEQNLSEIGRITAQRIEQLSALAWRPYRRLEHGIKMVSQVVWRRKRTLRWILWPDFYTVMLDVVLRRGYSLLREHEQLARRTETTLRNLAATGQYVKLGVIAINTPGAREVVGCTPALLARVKEAYNLVTRERERLRYLRA